MVKKILPVAILLLLSWLGLKAIFETSLYSAHDIWHNIARFHHYFAALQNGQFPPYWIANMAYGYGYPLFFFSYPLPWITGSVFLTLGIPLPIAFKLIVFLTFFLSGYFMYLLVQKITSDKIASITAAILYLFAPYHFLTVFISSSIGTLFIFMFLPLFILGLYLIFSGKLKSGIILTSLASSGLILSHLLTIVFILPVVIFLSIGFILNNPKLNRAKTLKGLIFSGLLALLLCAFYLIPAIFYSKYTAISDIGGFSDLVKNNFVNFNQLAYSKWGTGPITSYAKDGEISFQVGIAQWISIIGLLIISFLSKKNRPLNILILSCFALVIFLMLDPSAFLWNLAINFIAVDYPFRGLLSAVFLASLSAGLVLAFIKYKFLKIGLSLALVLIALYTNRHHTKIIMAVDNSYLDFVASEVTTNTFNEYRPKNSDLVFKLEGKIIDDQNLQPLPAYQNSFETGWNFEATQSSNVSLSQFSFPGQTLYINNLKTSYLPDDYGRINFPVEKGQYDAKVVFEPTSLILFSKLLTALGLISLAILAFRKNILK